MDAPLDPKLLALLADPTDPNRTPLELRGERLVNPVTGTAFPIVDGIPQLLPENAIPPGNAIPPEDATPSTDVTPAEDEVPVESPS